MTARTDAAILALLPDNTSGAINPVDIRDTWDTIVSKTPQSAKQWGAVGNGSTDDRAAIQAAIDAVSAGGGGTVLLPGSSAPYMIDGTIFLKANTILEGEMAGTILKSANGANATVVQVDGTTPLFGLRNLMIDGNRVAQNSNLAKFGFNVNVSAPTTDGSYSADSPFGSGLFDDPLYLVEHIMIVEVDGAGFRVAGGRGNLNNVTVVQASTKGAIVASEGAQLRACNVGGTAHEGFLVSGPQNNLNECKAFFTGTGRIGVTNSYGNYANGHGFTITGRGNSLVNCQPQDCDGWGFSVEANDTLISAGYIDQAVQLEAWSVHLGQTPTRGGGFVDEKAGLNLAANNCRIDAMVTARGVVNAQIAAELEGILRITGAASNNVVTLGYTVATLVTTSPSGVEVLEVSYTGANNRVLTRSGLLAP